MDDVDDQSVALHVFSPPYGVDKPYELGMTFDGWKALVTDVMKECDRTMMHGGRTCINVASTGREPNIPLATHVINIAFSIGWEMRGTVIWFKKVARESTAWGSWMSPTNPSFRDNCEFILVFNRAGEWSLPPGDSGITREEFIEFSRSEWFFSPDHAKEIGHPAPFPDELPRRCILFLTRKGDIVLDPFGGSGTTFKVARALGRIPVTYEINQEYIDVIKRRIDEPLRIQSEGWNLHQKIASQYPELVDVPLRKLIKRGIDLGIKGAKSMNIMALLEAITSTGTRSQTALDHFLP